MQNAKRKTSKTTRLLKQYNIKIHNMHNRKKEVRNNNNSLILLNYT